MYLIRNAQYKVAELLCYSIIFGLAIFPFLIYASEDLARVVYNTETLVKSDVLGGLSNTHVRLEILRLAFERWQASSMLFGEMFTGGTTVYLGGWWLFFVPTGEIAIHSDYLIILVEGGLVSYFVFNLALAWIIGSHFRWLRGQNAIGKSQDARAVMVAVAIPITITLSIVCSANPYLQYYGITFVVLFVLFCSEVSKRKHDQ